jgi:hypothetical protein
MKISVSHVKIFSSAAVTMATSPGSVFTGLALANNGTSNFLYAPSFVSGGTIHVFDSTFTSTTLAGSFTDPTIPVGYGPYNIQLLSGKLYVTYAQVGTRGAVIGPGLGFVSVFDTNGNFLQRLVSNGPLNAPWGLAIAPAGFMTSSRVAPPVSPRRSPPTIRQIVLVLPLLGLLFGLLVVRKTQPRLGWAGAALILTVLAGCGASYYTTRTPAGSYPISVAATSEGSSKTSTVILTVN